MTFVRRSLFTVCLRGSVCLRCARALRRTRVARAVRPDRPTRPPRAAIQLPDSLLPAPGQARQGHCHQPHPQHHGHRRRALGHCRSLAAAVATGIAARIEAWAQGISARRWIQGLLFFAAFFVITTLASLPLDWFGQHVEKSYRTSACRAGAVGLAIKARLSPSRSSSARPCCCSSTGSSAAGPAATGSASGSLRCRSSSCLVFVAAVA